MQLRRAAGRGCKWACICAAAMCLVGFVVSVFCWPQWSRPSGWDVGIVDGAIHVGWPIAHVGPPPVRTGFYVEKQYAGRRTGYWWPRVVTMRIFRFAEIPLWMPFLLTSIPAAWLWYRDRRRFGPGLCTYCGYDRASLAPDAKCPECATTPTK